MPPSNGRVKAVHDLANNYTETVHTLLAFSALVCHDGRQHRAGAQFELGRRMTTSKKNRAQPSTDVTPDCVAMKSEEYGVVAEVKKSLPNDRNRWGTVADQLMKYEDDLEGWWTSNKHIPTSDAVVLIHQSRGRALANFLTEVLGDGAPSKALVEFNRSDESASYIFFRREWGFIRDAELAALLEEGKQVPVEKVLLSYPNLGYYDARPPLELMMVRLWMDHFNEIQASTEPDERGVRRFDVTVEALTSDAQQAYGSAAIPGDDRSQVFPKKEWVREALDAFVRLGLAKRADVPDTYEISFRPIRGDLMTRFTKQLEGKPLAAPPEGQLSLPLAPTTKGALSSQEPPALGPLLTSATLAAQPPTPAPPQLASHDDQPKVADPSRPAAKGPAKRLPPPRKG